MGVATGAAKAVATVAGVSAGGSFKEKKVKSQAELVNPDWTLIKQ